MVPVTRTGGELGGYHGEGEFSALEAWKRTRRWCSFSVLPEFKSCAMAETEVVGLRQESEGEVLWPVLYKKSDCRVTVGPSSLKIYGAMKSKSRISDFLCI